LLFTFSYSIPFVSAVDFTAVAKHGERYQGVGQISS
jgi:hypothetical protein